jgi:hypothetical protein
MFKRFSVRMRRADPFEADFHLLEEISKPRACVNGGRITVWVYQDGPLVREIVLSGHAEHRTCASATSIIMEAAKQLGQSAQWMLTCGAAYFRVQPNNIFIQAEADSFADMFRRLLVGQGLPGQPFSSPGSNVQMILGQMIEALQQLEREKGLIKVIYQDWQKLEAFRAHFRGQAGASPCQIILPDPENADLVADFLPIIPVQDPTGEPLVFTLEGWDFDCPAFQQVADRHLHKVERELLRDALRRRRTYRGWLKEWMTDWIRDLRLLQRSEAQALNLKVPLSKEEVEALGLPEQEFFRGRHTKDMGVPVFLQEQASNFLDSGQIWPLELAALYSQMPFGLMLDAELDKLQYPKEITLVDFERGRTTKRRGTDADAYTLRERITSNHPGLITRCLHYIRIMDHIIKPYEELRKRTKDEKERGRDEGHRVVEEISRQIVIETMIRGWPSLYLDDERDQQVFNAWANKYRAHVWKIMKRQAKKRGVALDLLLEDNVVYQVCFNNDLGCTVQPLMLIDSASHAQVHGGRAGASASVALWAHRESKSLPQRIIQLGATNSERAARLIDEARASTGGLNADPRRAAEQLRLALTCHPPLAGELILQEWSNRLGRDTSKEFGCARNIVEAVKLYSKGRYKEAQQRVEDYLKSEPNPITDAYVLAALCPLMPDEEKLKEERELIDQHKKLAEKYNQMAARYNQALDLVKRNYATTMRRLTESVDVESGLINTGDIIELQSLDSEIAQAAGKLKQLEERIDLLQNYQEKVQDYRLELIHKALKDPKSVLKSPSVLNHLGKKASALVKTLFAGEPAAGKEPGAAGRGYPALSLAAQKARPELEATLENQGLYRSRSEAWHIRYQDCFLIVEVRALYEILYALSRIEHQIGQTANQARLAGLQEMKGLSNAIWLTDEIKSDLEMVSEEFAKGDWDNLQARQIRDLMMGAMASCLQRIQDLLTDPILIRMPLKESIVTRIHVTQTIEAKYKEALDLLFETRVPLGIATSGSWEVLNETIRNLPEAGRLDFDKRTGTICLDTESQRIALLRCQQLSADEIDYIARIFADPELRLKINQVATCLSEGILTLEVDPCRSWQMWRDALRIIRDELLYVISTFSSQACLSPLHSGEKTERVKQAESKMDRLPPRDYPSIDWQWDNAGAWRKLYGRNPLKSQIHRSS